jgi:hypothetical protein
MKLKLYFYISLMAHRGTKKNMEGKRKVVPKPK